MELRNILSPDTQTGAGYTRRIKQWVKETWELSQTSTVMVSELQCSEPGCPPRETIIAVFAAGEVSQQFKLHKAICDVTAQDIRALPLSGLQ